MRHLAFEEVRAVSGAGCEDLTMTVSITGVSINGTLSNWASCYDKFSDTLSGYWAHYTTGIPYGQAHVA
jgi:hypothetical protein